jgi:serine/threonine protein kinase
MKVKGEQPYFVMPLADGSVRDLLRQHPNGLPEAEAIRIFVGVMEAVAYAHSEGVIHRDIKPENVLMMDNQPVLTDFGFGRRLFSDSATLTVANGAMGTWGYAAPEQLEDAHTVDYRADVYALGAVLYELLCGKSPRFTIDLDAIPARFRFIVMRATHSQPERRFDSVAELGRELALLVGDSSALLVAGDRTAVLAQKLATAPDAATSSSDLEEFARLLIDNSDDIQLYLQVFTSTPAPVVKALATRLPGEFRKIMDAFDAYAAGGHPWSFTDTLARFLSVAYRSSSDMHVHRQILERLLVLGYEHNRWYVATRFVELAVHAIRDSAYVPLVADVLRSNPSAVPFVADGLRSHSMPPLISALLTS